MEKHINKMISEYLYKMKQDIINMIQTNEANPEMYISTYPNLNLTSEDLISCKPIRVKNIVDPEHQCIAIKTTGTRCSRHKLDNFEYCGTHKKDENCNNIHNCKYTPSIQSKKKIVSSNTKTSLNQNHSKKQLKISLENVNGIMYYIDNNNNVYDTEDIYMASIQNETRYNFIDNAKSIGTYCTDTNQITMNISNNQKK